MPMFPIRGRLSVVETAKARLVQVEPLRGSLGVERALNGRLWSKARLRGLLGAKVLTGRLGAV